MLRRLVVGARRRDWFTVSVELVTVVLGIFLGLRVDAWNDARIARVEESAYFGRLDRDMSRTLALLRSELEQLDTWFDETVALARALQDTEGGREESYTHRAAFAQSARVLIGRAQLRRLPSWYRVDGSPSSVTPTSDRRSRPARA